MSKLDDIINHIGSPWGEGAIYSHAQDTSHIDSDEEKELMKSDIKALFLELIDQVLRELPDEPTNQVNYTVSKLRQKVEEL